MHRPVALYHLLFGLASIAGGILGMAAGSLVSLITGSLTGIVLIIAGLSIQKMQRTGFWLAAVASLATAGYFGANFIRGRPFWYAGVMATMAVLSLLSLAVLFFQPAERKRDF